MRSKIELQECLRDSPKFRLVTISILLNTYLFNLPSFKVFFLKETP